MGMVVAWLRVASFGIVRAALKSIMAVASKRELLQAQTECTQLTTGTPKFLSTLAIALPLATMIAS
jgi:hypothetical protein